MKSFLGRRGEPSEKKTSSSPFKILIPGEPSIKVKNEKKDKVRGKKQSESKKSSCKSDDREIRKAKVKPEKVIQSIFPRSEESDKRSIRIYSSHQKICTQDGKKITTHRQHLKSPQDKKINCSFVSSRKQNLLNLIISNQNLIVNDQTSLRTKSIDRKKPLQILQESNVNLRGREKSFESLLSKECEISLKHSSDKCSNLMTTAEISAEGSHNSEKKCEALASICEKSIPEKVCSTSESNLDSQMHQNHTHLHFGEENRALHQPLQSHQKLKTSSLKTYHKRHSLGTQNVEVDAQKNSGREHCQEVTLNQLRDSSSTENWLDFLKGQNLPMDLEARKRFMTAAIENLARTELPYRNYQADKTGIFNSNQSSTNGSCIIVQSLSKPCDRVLDTLAIGKAAEPENHNLRSLSKQYNGVYVTNQERNRDTFDSDAIQSEFKLTANDIYTKEEIAHSCSMIENPRSEILKFQTDTLENDDSRSTFKISQNCSQFVNLQKLPVDHGDFVSEDSYFKDFRKQSQETNILNELPVECQVSNDKNSKEKHTSIYQQLEQANQASFIQTKCLYNCETQKFNCLKQSHGDENLKELQNEHNESYMTSGFSNIPSEQNKFLQELTEHSSNVKCSRRDNSNNDSQNCIEKLVQSIHGLLDIQKLIEHLQASSSILRQSIESSGSDCDASYMYIYADKCSFRISPKFLEEALKLKSDSLSKPLDEQSQNIFLGEIREICEEILETKIRHLKAKGIDDGMLQTQYQHERTSNHLNKTSQSKEESLVKKITTEEYDTGGINNSVNSEVSKIVKVSHSSDCNQNTSDIHFNQSSDCFQVTDFGNTQSIDVMKCNPENVDCEIYTNLDCDPLNFSGITDCMNDDIIYEMNKSLKLDDSQKITEDPIDGTKQKDEGLVFRPNECTSSATKLNFTRTTLKDEDVLQNSELDGLLSPDPEQISNKTDFSVVPNQLEDDHGIVSNPNQQVVSNEVERIEDPALTDFIPTANLVISADPKKSRDESEQNKVLRDLLHEGKEVLSVKIGSPSENMSNKNLATHLSKESNAVNKMNDVSVVPETVEKQTNNVKAVGDSAQSHSSNLTVEDRTYLRLMSLIQEPQDVKKPGVRVNTIDHKSIEKIEFHESEENLTDKTSRLQNNENSQVQVVLRRDSKQSILNTTEGILKVPTSNIDKQPVTILFEEVVPFIDPKIALSTFRNHNNNTIQSRTLTGFRINDEKNQTSMYPLGSKSKPPDSSKKVNESFNLHSLTARRRRDLSHKLSSICTVRNLHPTENSQIAYRVILPKPPTITFRPQDFSDSSEFVKVNTARDGPGVETSGRPRRCKPEVSNLADFSIEGLKLRGQSRSASKSPNKLKDNTFGISNIAETYRNIAIKQTKSLNLQETGSRMNIKINEKSELLKSEASCFDMLHEKSATTRIKSKNCLEDASKLQVFHLKKQSSSSYSSLTEVQKISASSLCSQCKSQIGLSSSRTYKQSTFCCFSEVKGLGSDVCHLCKIEDADLPARDNNLSKTRILSNVNIFNRTSTDVCLACELTEMRQMNEPETSSSVTRMPNHIESKKNRRHTDDLSLALSHTISLEDLSSVNPVKPCTSFVYQSVLNRSQKNWTAPKST